MSWLKAQFHNAFSALFRNNYCVVAYYPKDQSCDVYSFRTAKEAEDYVEALHILYGWAEDVEWHVRMIFLPSVKKRVVKDALAGKQGRIMDRNYNLTPPEE
jgi:hypothetical protein